MLDIYFETIEGKRHEPLTIKEERELLKDWPSARCKEQLANHNVRFVVDVAKRFKNSQIAFEDLIAYGNEGLCRALEDFDPGKGCRFITYAVWWINQIIKTAMWQDRQIKIPSNVAHDYRQITKAISDGYDENGYAPTVEDACEELGISVARGHRAILQTKPVKQLSREDGNGQELVDKYVSGDVLQDELLEKQDGHDHIVAMLDKLTSREQEVIKRYYGWEGDCETLEAISKDFELTRERMRQIRDIGLEKLRHPANKAGRELV